MSVRNQYARNYFNKVAPIPSNSTDITNARNAVRRRNLYQTSIDGPERKPRYNQTNNQPVRQPWNLSQPKSNPMKSNFYYDRETSTTNGVYGKQIYNDRNVNRKYGSLSEKTRMKVIAAREGRRDSRTFIADSKRINKSPIRSKSKSESDVRDTDDNIRHITGDSKPRTGILKYSTYDSRQTEYDQHSDNDVFTSEYDVIHSSEYDDKHSEYDVKQSDHDVKQSGYDVNNSGYDVKHSEDEDESDDDVKQHRPMSARPESRWARRNGEEAEEDKSSNSSDDSSNNTHDTDVSDSSTVNIYHQNENEPDVKKIGPSRPKTGHSRKNVAENKPVNNAYDLNKKKYDRPKSRVGNRKIPKWTGSQNYQIKQSRRPDSQEFIPYNPYIGYDSIKRHTNNNDIDYDIGINIFYPEVRNKLHEVDDINSQIDKIDKTVDPVLFFMQNDDPIQMLVERKRPSLSKDTINQINLEKNTAQNQNKNTPGLHGNVQNKCHSAPEKIDRFHRNKNPVLQNVIPESNQRYSNNWRHDNTGNMPIERGGKYTNMTRSNMDTYNQSKRNEYEIGRQFNRGGGMTVINRHNFDDKKQAFIYGRKAKKLQSVNVSSSDE